MYIYVYIVHIYIVQFFSSYYQFRLVYPPGSEETVPVAPRYSSLKPAPRTAVRDPQVSRTGYARTRRRTGGVNRSGGVATPPTNSAAAVAAAANVTSEQVDVNVTGVRLDSAVSPGDPYDYSRASVKIEPGIGESMDCHGSEVIVKQECIEEEIVFDSQVC